MHSSGNDLTALFLSQMRHRLPKVRVTGLVSTNPINVVGSVALVVRDSLIVTFGDNDISLDLAGANTERVVREANGGLRICWEVKLASGDSLTIEELD